jgi:cytochrome c-type biogenesis protein CcsB
MTRASNLAFGLALVLYLVAMVGYFHHLAYRRRAPLLGARIAVHLGLAAHLVSIVGRGIAADRVPWGNLYEYVVVTGFLIVAVYVLVVERFTRMRTLGGFVLGTAVLGMAGSILVYVPPGPLVPALNSYWIRIHVVAAMLATALFTLGFVCTVLYLIRDRRERRTEREARPPARAMAPLGGGMPHDLVPEADESEGVVTVTLPETVGNGSKEPVRSTRLPAAAALDSLAYKAIAFAFPIWTFAVIAGAIWAEQAWGRYWGWDPKEVWAFITWVVFAGYLHARATAGWRGTKAAVVGVIGFASMLVSYYVVNFVLVGLHTYGGVG